MFSKIKKDKERTATISLKLLLVIVFLLLLYLITGGIVGSFINHTFCYSPMVYPDDGSPPVVNDYACTIQYLIFLVFFIIASLLSLASVVLGALSVKSKKSKLAVTSILLGSLLFLFFLSNIYFFLLAVIM